MVLMAGLSNHAQFLDPSQTPVAVQVLGDLAGYAGIVPQQSQVGTQAGAASQLAEPFQQEGRNRLPANFIFLSFFEGTFDGSTQYMWGKGNVLRRGHGDQQGAVQT